MAGQSAHLSIAEAKACQMKIQHAGSHATTHGSSGGSKKASGGASNMGKKESHQG